MLLSPIIIWLVYHSVQLKSDQIIYMVQSEDTKPSSYDYTFYLPFINDRMLLNTSNAKS